MAIVLNPGVGGASVSTDVAGTEHFQKIKLAVGSTGVDGGVVHADNPLPIKFPEQSGVRDAFGRLRVSNPTALFDSKLLYDNQPLFWDEDLTGGVAASSHSTANAACTMTVDNSGEVITRQTFQRFDYQPGRSQLILMTGVMGDGVANTVKRIGMFDDDNGVFFEMNGTTMRIVVRKGGSDTAVAQDDWNFDKMDGTGTSGVTIAFDSAQIFVIDFQWLGVGTVRFGFEVDGMFRLCHQAHHANTVGSVYMSDPNLPLRYQASSTGGTATLVHICSAVLTEGGMVDNGVSRSLSTAGTHLNANSAGTLYAMMGIRLRSTHLGANIRPLAMTIMSETNDDFEWNILLNPTVADGASFTYSGITNSAVEGAVTDGANPSTNTVSGGTLMQAGFASDRLTTNVDLESSLRIGSAYDDTPDELVLCVRSLGGGADIQGTMTWRELW